MRLVSVVYDKNPPQYEAGESVTLTIDYESTDVQPNPNAGTLSFLPILTVTDTAGTTSPVFFQPGNGTIPEFTVTTPTTEPQPPTPSLADSGNHQWTLVSNEILDFDPTTGASLWEAVFTTELSWNL